MRKRLNPPIGSNNIKRSVVLGHKWQVGWVAQRNVELIYFLRRKFRTCFGTWSMQIGSTSCVVGLSCVFHIELVPPYYSRCYIDQSAVYLRLFFLAQRRILFRSFFAHLFSLSFSHSLSHSLSHFSSFVHSLSTTLLPCSQVQW